MILTEKATVHWSSKNRKHLESLGYTFTAHKDPVEVKVEHLMKGSNVRLKVRCPECQQDREVSYNNLSNGQSHRCVSCARSASAPAKVQKMNQVNQQAREAAQAAVPVPPKGVTFDFAKLTGGQVTQTERVTSKGPAKKEAAPVAEKPPVTLEAELPAEKDEIVVEFTVRSRNPQAVKDFFQGLLRG